MRSLEQILEQVRSFAGADFAFVLTRKGRLVTHKAPREMPETGRARLVRAARPLVGTDEISLVTMPREELVPYGGAAPVDAYLGVAAEQALICVVMATWVEQARVLPALRAGLRAIAPLLHRGIPPSRRGDHTPVRGSPYVGARSTMPPPTAVSPVTLESLDPLPNLGRFSMPEIHVAEAPLGRESLAAIHAENAPEITVSEAAMGRQSLAAVHRELAAESSPEITVSVADLSAADRDRAYSSSSPELVRVSIDSLPELLDPEPARLTQPWVESPEDAKRALSAERLARKVAPPKVSIKLEELDEETHEHSKRK